MTSILNEDEISVIERNVDAYEFMNLSCRDRKRLIATIRFLQKELELQVKQGCDLAQLNSKLVQNIAEVKAKCEHLGALLEPSSKEAQVSISEITTSIKNSRALPDEVDSTFRTRSS